LFIFGPKKRTNPLVLPAGYGKALLSLDSRHGATSKGNALIIMISLSAYVGRMIASSDAALQACGKA
jgi:hypothetical protein